MRTVINKINEVGFMEIWWSTLKSVAIVGAVGAVACAVIREGKEIMEEINR